MLMDGLGLDDARLLVSSSIGGESSRCESWVRQARSG